MSEKNWNRFSAITGITGIGLLILLLFIDSILPGDGVPVMVAIPTFVVISILVFLFILSVVRKGSGEKNLSLKTVLKTIAYISIILAILIIRDKLRGN